MRIIVSEDRQHMGSYVACQAADILRSCLNQREVVNLVVATGSSQFEVLSQLVQQPDIDWSRIHGFHLDEYLGIDRSHPASFCGYLHERFVKHVPLGSFFYLDGTIPPNSLLETANNRLRGKRIDMMLCGIGENGHLAFNDPPADFQSDDAYLIVQLDEACRRQQVGEGWFDNLEAVPQRAISMTIRQMMRAESILCSVPDRRKAEAVRCTLEGPVTPTVPASILQQHPNVQLILDTDSSSLIGPNVREKFEEIPLR